MTDVIFGALLAGLAVGWIGGFVQGRRLAEREFERWERRRARYLRLMEERRWRYSGINGGGQEEKPHAPAPTTVSIPLDPPPTSPGRRYGGAS